MTPTAGRLKDILWTLRQQFNLGNDVDRIIPYLVFEQTLTEEQFNNLFISYPKRVPRDFKLALLARIQQVVRQFRRFHTTQKNYQKIFGGILSLEDVARYGPEGCELVNDPQWGWQLRIKPELRKKRKK